MGTEVKESERIALDPALEVGAQQGNLPARIDEEQKHQNAQLAREHRAESTAVAARASFHEMLQLGETLFRSGFLSSQIKNGAQATAIILTGQELKIGPMLALRSIRIIDGNPTIGADLQLGLFKRDGGRARFKELTDQRAVLELVHPNGDTHVETFTIQDAERAGLLRPTRGGQPSNYLKFPRPMLRSRCITAALKSIGYEPTSGMYDPDEAQHFPSMESGALDPAFAYADEAAAAQYASGTSAPAAASAGLPAQFNSRYQVKYPFGDLRGRYLDEQNDQREYVCADDDLQRAFKWTQQKLDGTGSGKPMEEKDRPKFTALREAIESEMERRLAERDAADAEGDLPDPTRAQTSTAQDSGQQSEQVSSTREIESKSATGAKQNSKPTSAPATGAELRDDVDPLLAKNGDLFSIKGLTLGAALMRWQGVTDSAGHTWTEADIIENFNLMHGTNHKLPEKSE